MKGAEHASVIQTNDVLLNKHEHMVGQGREEKATPSRQTEGVETPLVRFRQTVSCLSHN